MSQRQNPQTLLQLRIELRYTDPLIWRRVLVPDTITLAHLHAVGVQFSNFHTSVSCSPSRAMLITGTDNHIAGLGNMCDCDFNQDGSGLHAVQRRIQWPVRDVVRPVTGYE